jgi:hypothetical protein
MSAATDKAALDGLILRHEIEQFFNHENELLDTRRFDAWLDLLADDLRYWMPLARNRPCDDLNGEWTREGKDLNWFDEGKFEMEPTPPWCLARRASSTPAMTATWSRSG